MHCTLAGHLAQAWGRYAMGSSCCWCLIGRTQPSNWVMKAQCCWSVAGVDMVQPLCLLLGEGLVCPASLLHVLGVQKGCKSVVVTLLRALPKLLHGNCVLQWRNVAAAASCKEIVCVSGQSWLLVSCCSPVGVLNEAAAVPAWRRHATVYKGMLLALSMLCRKVAYGSGSVPGGSPIAWSWGPPWCL
jgi:hypothetical protein